MNKAKCDSPSKAGTFSASKPGCCDSPSKAGALSASKPGCCDECKKKVGLMGMKCRCGKCYCVSHIVAEEHNCTYDYKTEGLKTLSTLMVAVVADKMDGRL